MKPPEPAGFFAAQLPGEEPLSFQTAGELHSLATEFQKLRPWLLLDETQLILTQDPSGQRHACSVMGALGEHTALAVYVGTKGYNFFQTIHAVKIINAGEFLALQHSISAEFDWPSELTKPDRELLRAFGYTRSKGDFVPIFRTVRPGYHPWYVTQSEGEILAEGLSASIALVELLKDGEPNRYWLTPEIFPLMIRSGADAAGRPLYRLEMASPPRAERAPQARPQLDEARLSRILAAKLSRRETVELDQFWGATPIGKKTERKSCMRGAAAINAETGFAYPPQVVSPEVPAAQLLADVLFDVIEIEGFLPKRVHVRNAQYQAALQPLAHLLGFELKVAPEMPALDFFKRELLASMGERGPIPL